MTMDKLQTRDNLQIEYQEGVDGTSHLKNALFKWKVSGATLFFACVALLMPQTSPARIL